MATTARARAIRPICGGCSWERWCPALAATIGPDEVLAFEAAPSEKKTPSACGDRRSGEVVTFEAAPREKNSCGAAGPAATTPTAAESA